MRGAVARASAALGLCVVAPVVTSVGFALLAPAASANDSTPIAREQIAKRAPELPVGEVVFVAGPASLARADALAGGKLVRRGASIRVGDVVTTEAGGHVHVRFVDGAFVSVRPGSELVVSDYAFDAVEPQRSRVKFDLRTGVARSITGRAGEAAKERFRLNTPIAAVGVRGTDFVVLAQRAQTRVAVNSGAVVVAPFDGIECTADGTGPCATTLARELSASMGDFFLAVEGNGMVPTLVAGRSGPESPDGLAPPAATEPARLGADGKTRTGGRSPAEQVATTVAAQAAEVIAMAQVPEIPPPPPEPLVWGRWATAVAAEDAALPFADASKGREVTVANAHWALLRTPASPFELPRQGVAQFRLDDAQAFLMNAAGAASAGRVDRGSLRIDFNTARFDTQLSVSHDALPAAVSIEAAGRVRDDGILRTVGAQSNARVAGAVTSGGQEAGYFFDRDLGAGNSLIGNTRWSR